MRRGGKRREGGGVEGSSCNFPRCLYRLLGKGPEDPRALDASVGAKALKNTTILKTGVRGTP